MSRLLVLGILLTGCVPQRLDYAQEPPAGPHLFDRLVRENRHQDMKAVAEKELAVQFLGLPLGEAVATLIAWGAACPEPVKVCTYENRYGFVATRSGKLVEERNTYFDWLIDLKTESGAVTAVSVEIESSKAPFGR